MRLPSKWSAHLKGEDKKNFEDLLGINNKVLDRLREICYNMLSESEKVSNDYDSPNWALRTADSVGYRRGLEAVIKLCTPAEQRDHA